jgi:hypothetical protein
MIFIQHFQLELVRYALITCIAKIKAIQSSKLCLLLIMDRDGNSLQPHLLQMFLQLTQGKQITFVGVKTHL